MQNRKAIILTTEEWDKLLIILDQPRFYDADVLHLLQRISQQLTPTPETHLIQDPENPNRMKIVRE